MRVMIIYKEGSLDEFQGDINQAEFKVVQLGKSASGQIDHPSRSDKTLVRAAVIHPNDDGFTVRKIRDFDFLVKRNAPNRAGVVTVVKYFIVGRVFVDPRGFLGVPGRLSNNVLP